MAKTQLSDSDFKKLVRQSNLVISESDEKTIRPQLSEALSAVRVLDELDTKNVPTLDHPTGDLKNVWREDVVEPSLPQDLALSQAHEQHEGYVVTKAVFDEQ